MMRDMLLLRAPCCVLLLVLLVIFSSVAPPVLGAAPPATRYLFVFGDSYSATGFNFTQQQPQPTPGNPFGNPPTPGATTAGGANWIGTLVTMLSPLNTLAYNYAAVGATVNETFYSYGAPGQNFNDQVQQFSQGPGAITGFAIPWRDRANYFLIWFGVNDVKNAVSQAQISGLPLDQIFDRVLDNYVSSLGRLHAFGARNFVLFEVPPFNRSQYTQIAGGAYQAAVTKAIPLWNAGLRARVQGFVASHEGARVQVLETAPTFNMALDNPRAWGAVNNLCADRDGTTCLWWDTLHPGVYIQMLMGVKAFKVLTGLGFYSDVRAWAARAPTLLAKLAVLGIVAA